LEAGLAKTDEIPPDRVLASLDEASWTARAKCAERVAALYCQGRLDAIERGLAEETFRLLCYDGEIVVRRLLAECLKRVPRLPRDIALPLATDRSEIAVPFIEESPSLADRDLMAILRDHPGPHRTAIAVRQRVSEAVTDALCRCDDATTAATVLANEGAAVAPTTLHWLLDTRPEPRILEAIARRRLLPITVGERLWRVLKDPVDGPHHARATIERVAV
jgi:uncharacterized protein (DUF2336 family)